MKGYVPVFADGMGTEVGGELFEDGAQLEGLAESAWKDIGLSRDNVLIGGNLLIYYEEGDPGKRVAPDLFIARALSGAP